MTAWVLDLDGVLWRGAVEIPGSVDAVNTLLERGDQVVFATNNAWAEPETHERRLADMGIADTAGRAITSALAAASLVDSGERVAVLGGPGLRSAVLDRDAVLVPFDDAPLVGAADALLVGLDKDLSYARLGAAVRAVLGGARLIASNTDPTFPTDSDPLPGAGAVVAAVERATATVAVVAGKPNGPMAALARRRLAGLGADLTDVVMVGDRFSTDGRFAGALGARFVRVRSGIDADETSAAQVATFAEVDDLAAAIRAV